jgi:hypothetical protein
MHPEPGEITGRDSQQQRSAGARTNGAAAASAPNEGQSLSPLIAPILEKRELFWPKLGPIVDSLQRANSNSTRIECSKQLEGFLAIHENREIVWDFVAGHGIPKGLRPQERLEFARTILPFVSPEESRSIQALVKISQQAVEAKHQELYKIVGERCLSVELDSTVMRELAGAFASYETHNIEREECLAPWDKLFVEKGDGNVFRACAAAIQSRVESNEFSSFDHLVAVLCRAHQSESKVVLQELVDRQLKSDPSIGRQLRGVAKATFQELFENIRPSMVLRRALLAAPVAFLIEAVSNSTLVPQLNEVFAHSLGIATAWTVAAAYVKSRRRVDMLIKETDSERLATQKENTYLESEAFLHLAEKVYKRLVDNQAQSPEIRPLLTAMESNPLFNDEIPRWCAPTTVRTSP